MPLANAVVKQGISSHSAKSFSSSPQDDMTVRLFNLNSILSWWNNLKKFCCEIKKNSAMGRIYKLGENIASNKNRYQTYKQNQCRGEPYVRPSDINRYQTNYVREWIRNDCLGHRFTNDCCSEGEHKVRPYIGFGHLLGFGFFRGNIIRDFLICTYAHQYWHLFLIALFRDKINCLN